MYQQYLILFAELRRNKKAKIRYENEEISISSPKNGVWILESNLIEYSEKIPSKVAECLFSCGLLAFQNKGPSLVHEGKKIILKNAYREILSFIEFKSVIKNFHYAIKEWRGTLGDLSRQSPSLYNQSKLLFAY